MINLHERMLPTSENNNALLENISIDWQKFTNKYLASCASFQTYTPKLNLLPDIHLTNEHCIEKEKQIISDFQTDFPLSPVTFESEENGENLPPNNRVNSVAPEQTPYNAAFGLGASFFFRPSCSNSLGKYGIQVLLTND